MMRISELNDLRDDRLRAKSRAKKFPEISREELERNAIKFYTGYGFHEINAPLRGLDPEYVYDPDEMKQEYGFVMTAKDAVKILDEMIANSPKKNLTVYRGEMDRNHASKLKDMEIGQSYSDPAFISASLSASYAFFAFATRESAAQNLPLSGTLSMINVSKSVGSAYISDNDHTETEIILARNTKLTLKEKRIIPNKIKGHKLTKVYLLIWDAS